MFYNLVGQRVEEGPFEWIAGVKDTDAGREQADRLVANGDWWSVGMKQAGNDKMKHWTYFTCIGYGPTVPKKKKKKVKLPELFNEANTT